MQIELYKPYKTRGGWRAVAVDKTEHGFMTYQKDCVTQLIHVSPEGVMYGDRFTDTTDLVEPWTEPQSGQVWVHVQKDLPDGQISFQVSNTEYFYRNTHKKTLAIIGPIDWVEGQGL